MISEHTRLVRLRPEHSPSCINNSDKLGPQMGSSGRLRSNKRPREYLPWDGLVMDRAANARADSHAEDQESFRSLVSCVLLAVV